MKLDDTRRTTISILGVVVLVCVSAGAIAGPYEDCILQNMKGVQAQAAAGAIMRACKEKTTPKKCREAVIRGNDPDFSKGGVLAPFADLPVSPIYLKQLLDQCLVECATASYWSRTFGECRTD